MKSFEKLGSSVLRKAVLASALLGAGLAFFGAWSKSATPRVVVGIGGRVIVERGYRAHPVRYDGPA